MPYTDEPGRRCMDQHRLVALAIKGLEAEQLRIESGLAALRGSPRQPTANETRTSSGRRRRRMSAAARMKISEALKAQPRATQGSTEEVASQGRGGNGPRCRHS